MPSAYSRVGVVPARVQLDQRDPVRPVAVDLVRAHVDERALGTAAPRGLEQVQRADGVGVEVVEGNGRRTIVGGLRGGVDDHGRAQSRHQIEHALRSRMSSSWWRNDGSSRSSRCWFQRVSPCGPKKTARWLLSTPWTS